MSRMYVVYLLCLKLGQIYFNQSAEKLKVSDIILDLNSNVVYYSG